MANSIIFSGIQPSGSLHLGNYLGAIKQWIALQSASNFEDGDKNQEVEPGDATSKVQIPNSNNKFIFCIVDLHAITVPQDPIELRKNIIDVAAWYLAAGLDGGKSTVFVQSENPDHPYLGWIFNCMTSMGQMERMTQFKDKSSKQGERTSVGLFAYPTLMAADILLYDTDLVPVGEDQVQHIELTRDIGEKFNKKYGETFKIPKVMLQKNVARIKSLQDPNAKMSKSMSDPNGTINLSDSPDLIKNKLARAVTDSGNEIVAREDKPAMSNLLAIYSAFSGESIESLEAKYQGKSYSEFKMNLSDTVISHLKPIQEKHDQLMEDHAQIIEILDKGAATARSISSKKIATVKSAIGLKR